MKALDCCPSQCYNNNTPQILAKHTMYTLSLDYFGYEQEIHVKTDTSMTRHKLQGSVQLMYHKKLRDSFGRKMSQYNWPFLILQSWPSTIHLDTILCPFFSTNQDKWCDNDTCIECYTFQRGSSLGFTTEPVSLDSSAANANRCDFKDTFGPAMKNRINSNICMKTVHFLKQSAT